MRLDSYLTENGYFDSRTKAKQAVERGEVCIDGKTVVKPSFDIGENSKIELLRNISFVSLGGYKLKKALSDFSFSVKNFVAADIGASTGGFTDCLLKNGAAKVYAVDLNDKLLHKNLKNDNRVVSVIKNARFLSRADFHDKIDLITADLSFISSTYVMPVLAKLIDNDAYIILLIKPQFETGSKTKFKNGIIRDKQVIYAAVRKVCGCAEQNGLEPVNITSAPEDKEKNSEFLVLLQKKSESMINCFNLNEYFNKI